MRKFTTMAILAIALFAVAACGRGNNGNVAEDSTAQPQQTQLQDPQQPSDTQEQNQNETTSANESTTETAMSTSGTYYTFGDIINIRDELEIVFLDGVIITEQLTPRVTPSDNAPQITWDNYERIKGREVVKIPVILTNVSELARPQNLEFVYFAYGPSGERQEGDVGGPLFAIAVSMADPITGYIYGDVHDSVPTGESIEGYVFLIYDGNGDYWIHWPDRLGGMQVRLPISR